MAAVECCFSGANLALRATVAAISKVVISKKKLQTLENYGN
jgi:hypothetical protein